MAPSHPDRWSRLDPDLFGDPGEGRMVGGLSVTEAGELLDWLEGHGIRDREVQITPDGRMAVRWAA